MAVTLRQLRALVAVAETGNFTRAAERLHTAQSMVSGLVGDLEAELGFRLFDRTTRRVSLTRAASEFLDDARRLTGDLDRAVQRARDVGARRGGHLGVGAPPLLASCLLPRVVGEFSRTAPEVRVTVWDRPIAFLEAMVRSGELELAVGTFPLGQGLARLPLVVDQLALLCRSDHPLAERRELRWADLADLPLVTLRVGNGIREQVESGFQAAGLQPGIAFELDQLQTVIAMAEAGFGVAVLPTFALDVPSRTALVVRPLREPTITRRIDAIHREDRSLSPAATEFTRLLRAAAQRPRDDE